MFLVMPEEAKYRERYNGPNSVMRVVEGKKNRVYAGKRIENPDGSISYDTTGVRGGNSYAGYMRTLAPRTINQLRRANAVR